MAQQSVFRESEDAELGHQVLNGRLRSGQETEIGRVDPPRSSIGIQNPRGIVFRVERDRNQLEVGDGPLPAGRLQLRHLGRRSRAHLGIRTPGEYEIEHHLFSLETSWLNHLAILVVKGEIRKILTHFTKGAAAPYDRVLAQGGAGLFNDGVAFVVFILALAASGPGATFSIGAAIGQFFIDAIGGLGVGLALGYVVSSLILKNLDDHLIETVVTVALAFGSYLLAEEFGSILGLEDVHLSGILSVVAAGLMVGNIGLRNTSPTTRLTLENFWEFLAFVVNSLVFLLLGLQIHVNDLWDRAGAVLVAVVAVQITRLVVVYGLGAVHGMLQPDRKIPRAYQHVMFWGGLRGAISVALALSLSAEKFRLDPELVSTLQVMTFGVVLFTLLVQGLSIEHLIRRLGLAAKPAERIEQQRRQARIYAQQAGLDELERLHGQGILFRDLYEAMADLYKGELARDSEELRDHLRRYPELETDMYIRARADTLQAERSALQDAARRGFISNEVLAELSAEVNEHLAALEFIEGDARQGEVLPVESDEVADDA